MDMRIVCIATNHRKYPRYVAEMREGRFKGGPYPQGIQHVPSLKRQWDRGGLGAGTKLTEFEAEELGDLLGQLYAKGINPRFDDVEIFQIRSMGSPRVRVPTHQLYDVHRTPASEGSAIQE
jgi:hypothetical protein